MVSAHVACLRFDSCFCSNSCLTFIPGQTRDNGTAHTCHPRHPHCTKLKFRFSSDCVFFSSLFDPVSLMNQIAFLLPSLLRFNGMSPQIALAVSQCRGELWIWWWAIKWIQKATSRYGNVCRKALIVYKVTIPRTGKYYISATSQTLKKRVAGHLQSARQFLRNGTRSSTLAIHLAQMWQQSSDSIPSAGMLRDELSCSILWQSDPFSCSKMFGKLSCKLCKKERVALLRHSWMDEWNMLNDRSELHGSCRHTARFHRLFMRSGTDDSE
jgi:hypothetical protein